MADHSGHNKRRKFATPYIPDDLIETILLRLPLRELCRLSVLSRRFRYTWKLSRDLSFDGAGMSREKFKSAVTRVLARHASTGADAFRLRYDAAGEASHVSRWIHRAVRLGIHEFELDLTPSTKKFMLSSNLVSVDTIKVMKLVNCELHLPFRSNGLLRNLRELTFQSMRARPLAVQAIFRNCHRLETLKLVDCSYVYSLKIYAQNLEGFKTLVVKDCTDVHSVYLNAPAIRTFHYRGKICEVNFQSDLPHLNDVVVEIEHPRGFQLIPNRKEMITSLAFVRSLTVTSIFLEGLKDAVFCMWKLKEFHLIVAPESYINPSDVAMFLKSCPGVECIFIDLGQNAFNGDNYHWRLIGKKYLEEYEEMFPCLKYAKIKGFSLKEQPVMMGRFILKHAQFLQSMVIVKAKNGNCGYVDDAMIPECLRWGFPSNAKVEMYEYQGDKSAVIPRI